MSRKNRKDRSTGKRKGRKIRLIAASATASAVIAVSPYIASASGTSAAVTAALDGGGSGASSVLDGTKQDEEKKEEKEDQKKDQKEDQKDPESGKTEEEKHIESDSEAAERKMFESMLKEAGSVKGMTKHYGYTESKGSVSRNDIHSGNIVSIDDVFYIVAEYEDTDGNSQKMLWREDGSGSFMAGTEFPETCDHVYTLEKKEPDVSVPEGLTGAEGQKLSEVTLPDGFSWKNPDTELAAGENTCEAVYTPQNTVVYSEKTVSVTVKATPKVHELTLPSPSYSVSYSPDMKVSDVTLPDNWAFENPDAKISLGTDVYKVVFTGDKKLSWSAPTNDVTVKITASKKHVSFDGVFVTVNQGTALTDSILPETAGGRLSWKTTGLKVDTAGTFTYYAIYVPDDLDRFDVTDNIPVTVTVRAPKELKRPESSYSVVYEPGTKVSTIALPENWAFDTPDATIAAGTHTYRVSFTGDKTDNWVGSTDSFDVSITATKRTISVDPISITVDEGAALSDSMLPSIPGGTLKWKTAGENAGSAQSVHYAVFYPTDSDRYDSTDSVAVTVSVRKKAVTPTPPSKNTGSDKGESEVIDKVDDKPSKPSSDKNSDKSSDKADKTSDKTDKTPSKSSDKTSNKDDKSSGKTDKVSDGPSDTGNGYKPVSSAKDSTKSDTTKNDTPSSTDTSKTATPSSRSSDGDDDTPVTAKGSKKAKSDDDVTDRDAPAKKSTKGTKGTAAVYPKKPSSSDSSASSAKPKKKIKLKNISDSQIIPVVAPSAAEKKTSSPSVSNVEAKPVTGSDTHSSTLKDVDVSAVKPSDKGSGKSSEKKKNKKKTSDSDVYTPDDTNSLHAKEDTPDQMFNSASGVKDDDTGKNTSGKKVASPSSAKKSNIGIIAAGGAVAAAAVGAGVYVFMKKRNGEDSEFDISGAVTRGDDDDDDDDGTSLHGF